MTFRARSTAVAAALLVAGLVAGCSDEDPPRPIESTKSSSGPSSPSSAATTEPTPTGPVEPTLPAEAREETEAGAEAFVRFYYAMINYATATGEVTNLERLHEPSCEGCQGGIDQVERVYDRGGRIEGSGYQVLRVETIRLRDGFWSVTARTRIGDQFVRGAGDLNQKFPGGRGGLHFTLRFRDSVWRTTSLEGS